MNKFIDTATYYLYKMCGCLLYTSLLMEWGLLKGNDLQLNSHKIIKYLTLGAVRREGVVYPDRAWGYGRLNLLKTFNELVTGRT